MKLKFDVSDTDPAKASATGTSFEPPPPGTYVCRIDDASLGKSRKGDEMITLVYEIATGEHKNKKLWDRIVLTKAAEWKLDQFLQAVGVASSRKRKGVLDLEEILGDSIVVQVKRGEYEGNPTAEVARVSAAADDDDLDDEDEDFDESDDIEDSDDDDLEDEDEDEPDESDESDDSEEADDDYETWSLAELRQELKDRELNAKGAKPALIARLRESDQELF